MEKLILKRIKNFKKEINVLFSKIKEYDRIAIFRHDHPDYDALGSQLAFVSFIRDNFKNKEVVFVGDNHVTLSKKCFPKMMELNDSWFDKPFLAIIVDLADISRVADERCSKASYKIKIDHHPQVDSYADIEIVDPTMVAAGELIAAIFMSKNYDISEETASYLWKAIVGDSGRFLYNETSSYTFLIAQKLLQTGIDIQQLYNDMYEDDVSNLDVKKYILENYKVSKHGVAYYVLTDKELKQFKLTPIQGKDNINVFAHYNKINAWVSCTEDKAKGHWRVSIRSKSKSINSIADKYNGGGHDNASGCKIKTLEELEKLINDLDKLFK